MSSSSTFAYLKQPKTGWWEGLGTRLSVSLHCERRGVEGEGGGGTRLSVSLHCERRGVEGEGGENKAQCITSL